MLLAVPPFTIVGIAVGVTLWIGVMVTVARREPPPPEPDGLVDMPEPEGRCSGAGGTPAPMSSGRTRLGRRTGVCAVCSRRMRLDGAGLLPDHGAASAHPS